MGDAMGTRESRWETWGNYRFGGPYDASIRVMAAAARLCFGPDAVGGVRDVTERANGTAKIADGIPSPY